MMMMLSTAPWTLLVPSVRLDIATFDKDTTDPVAYKQFYLKWLMNIMISKRFLPTAQNHIGG